MMTNQQQAIEIAKALGLQFEMSADATNVLLAPLRVFNPHSDWRDIGLITKRLWSDGFLVIYDINGVTIQSKCLNNYDSNKPADKGGVAEVFCKAYGIEVTE